MGFIETLNSLPFDVLMGLVFSFAIAFAALICAISFKAAENLLMKTKENFEENSVRGWATITGYQNAGDPTKRLCDLLVKLHDLPEDQVMQHCKTGSYRKTDYPVGRDVEVLYCTTKVWGIETYDIRLVSSMPPDERHVIKFFHWATIVSWVICAGTTILGVYLIVNIMI